MKINYCLEKQGARSLFKKHEDDACWDLFACERIATTDMYLVGYDTGISFDIPPGYCGKVYARSSIIKSGLILANGTGIIDSGYKGTVKMFFYKITPDALPFQVGDRIAQIMFVPTHNWDGNFSRIELNEVDFIVKDSLRGENGFGSTGIK